MLFGHGKPDLSLQNIESNHLIWYNLIVEKPTKEAFVAAYISGFWFDLIHNFATVIFLWFLTNPILQKLERVKKKYGIMREVN